jgi:hypothetical protein
VNALAAMTAQRDAFREALYRVTKQRDELEAYWRDHFLAVCQNMQATGEAQALLHQGLACLCRGDDAHGLKPTDRAEAMAALEEAADLLRDHPMPSQLQPKPATIEVEL